MKPRLLVSIIAVVALMIAGAATIVLAANQPPRSPYSSYPRETRDPNQPPGCARSVELTFRTDAEMFRASNDLDNDTRFYNPAYLTQAQNYERLKRALAGQPELLKQLRPESVPATATVRLAYSDSDRNRQLLDELEQTYGRTKVADPCALPTSSTRPVPTTTVPMTVPTTGPTTTRRR
nr:hypothetical protein [Kibdelosporangium sp. MJ126-NF4]CEL21207.1 hypothetical protein [Kibdelosporangium sp. MJ126-NF4]CTQ96227.1 hypothetical protein [Kibdelosporangium sp. MJ126-NF4]